MTDDHETRLRVLEETRVTREKGDEFWAHKTTQVIVYGMVGLILVAVIGALIALVVRT
jgi:hypothetical protein